MQEKQELLTIPMGMILEPSHQLREKITEEGLEELKRSMVRRGLINPITVRKKGDAYEIGAGHRRFLAARELGWTEIKAILKEATDEEWRLEAIHENLHREDLSPVEESRQIGLLYAEYGHTIKEISRLCSKSESWVNSRLDMLEWPSNILEAVDVGAISVSAARELVAITDDQAREYYLDHAIKAGATATLCAFWHRNWEVQRITRDPTAPGDATFYVNPPPMEPTIPCFLCGEETPIKLIDHLRVCPTCGPVMIQAKKMYDLERFKASTASGGTGENRALSPPKESPGH